MAYIGNTLQNQNYVPAIDYFSGDGSTTAFTASRPIASVAQVQAVISNVPQNPGTAFTVSGNTITFTSAPPSGTNNIYVYYTSPNTQVVQPGQGTVTTTSIVDGSVTPAKLSTGYPYWDASGNVGVGTSSPVSAGGYTGFTVKNTTYGGIIQNTDGTVDFRSMLTASTNALVGTWSNHPTSFVTNATARMTIDSSGRVTMPYQPAFHVTDISSSAVQQSELVFLTANGTGFTFNNGSYYSTSTGRFTAPVAGKYMFTFTLRADSTTSYFHPQFKVNGNIVSNGQMIWGGALDYKSLCSSVIYSLAAGDYVSVTTQGSQNNTGNLSPAAQQTFSGFLVC